MPGTNDPQALQIVDPVLTSIARRYAPNVGGFISDRLMPAIPTATLSAQYPIFDESYWFAQLTDNKYEDRSPTKEVNFTWSTDTYLCEEYALKTSITELERLQAHPAIRLERSKTEFLNLQMALAREIRAAAILDVISAGGGITSANTFDANPNWDQATATIEADIKTGVLAVYDKIGYVPNTLVIPYKVAYAMAVQEDIRAILTYNTTGVSRDPLVLGDRLLPAVIHGMDVVIPTGAQKNTAAEGATKSITEIWGDKVRLLYVDPSATWGQPSVAYRMVHTAPTVTRWRQADPDVEYVRQMERVDEKITAPDAGYVISGALS